VTPGVIFLGFGLAGMKERSSAIRKPDTEIPSKILTASKQVMKPTICNLRRKMVCPKFLFSLNNKLIQC
jgi:hypothetical protein